MLPPVQTDLLGLIHGTHQQAYPDRQQLHVGESNADIARDDQSLVEDTVKNIDQVRVARGDRDAIHSVLGDN